MKLLNLKRAFSFDVYHEVRSNVSYNNASVELFWHFYAWRNRHCIECSCKVIMVNRPNSREELDQVITLRLSIVLSKKRSSEE